MKNLKLMPKIFLYTLFSMLLVVGLSQGLIYLLALPIAPATSR